MKNMLKKIGVIGIIIAMLAPFVEMPVAEAATQTCSDHTVLQYYFADVTNGDSWKHYTEDGYATYTIFPYTFPEETGKSIKILKTQLLNVVSDSNTSAENTITTANFWSDVKSLENTKTYQISGNEIAGNYLTKDKSDYKVSKLLHGIWAKESATSYEKADWEKATVDDDGNYRETYLLNHSIQKIFSKDETTITVSSARYLNSNYVFGSADEKTLDEYFENLVSKDNDEYVKDAEGEKVFALRVNRKISSSTLNSKYFGFKCESDSCDDESYDGKYAIFTTDKSGDTVKNSYSALISDSSGKNIVDTDENIDIFTNEAYYWPAVLTVEYEVCTNTSETWTLKYDGNTSDDSANNIPEKVQKSVGEDVEIDSKTPTRSGYTFKGWNTEKDGSGKTYNAGDKYESPDSSDVIVLYAQWGDTSKGNQEKTGVASYIIGFVSVGIVASGIYLIAKKKNLFKQI